VYALGFRVSGFEFRVSCFGFRVSGSPSPHPAPARPTRESPSSPKPGLGFRV